MKNFQTTFRGSVTRACELYRQLESLDATLTVDSIPLHVEVMGEPTRLEIYILGKVPQIMHHTDNGDVPVKPPYAIILDGVSYKFRTDAPPALAAPRELKHR
jgi:hypothetical protein